MPAREGGFKLIFYPLAMQPSKTEVLSPAFEAVFARPSGDDLCMRIGSGQSRTLGPAVPAGLSMKDYDRTETRLFVSLGRTADLYRQGGTPDKRPLRDFLDAFQTLAEPGMLPDYYRLNPDFWEWLRREGGRSIEKPAT